MLVVQKPFDFTEAKVWLEPKWLMIRVCGPSLEWENKSSVSYWQTGDEAKTMVEGYNAVISYYTRAY